MVLGVSSSHLNFDSPGDKQYEPLWGLREFHTTVLYGYDYLSMP